MTITLSTLLVFVLGTAGVVGWLTFLRAPDSPPSAACGAEPTRPRLVAAGASMTQGSLGADWVGAVRARHPAYEVVNAGVNGNKVADLLARVETDVVACRPAAVTLLIGTNDVRDDVPPDRYRADLRTLVERVTTTGARVALMSLPPLGEDLDTGPNLRLPAYNAAIKEVAAATGADYLPLYERMADTLSQAGPRTPYAFSFPLALTVAAQHHLLRRSWDEIAASGGRMLLVDHIHLTDRAASMVTDLTAAWLTGKP
ncbi:GDSL-type esterase/lipase family protein [Nonomuraea sp. NPDC004580]|uniref:SGNH/GDSL hydrolase family protein n=1 Tax=Nonomuraea sp. NPDC004580 TaxID=3154552 RepID=UPI00339F2B5F